MSNFTLPLPLFTYKENLNHFKQVDAEEFSQRLKITSHFPSTFKGELLSQAHISK